MKVGSAGEHPYVVVQFLQLPHTDIGDNIFIPRSWIRICRVTDRKSLVAYPDEHPSITKMRILNGDEPSEKWQLYMAIVKFEARSYEDAYEFIKQKQNKTYYDSRKRNSDIIRTNYKCVPISTTKRNSPSLKTINPTSQSNQLNPQLEKNNKNKLKAIDKVGRSDMILNPSKYPEHSNVESRTLTSSTLPGLVSPENILTKEIYEREHQDQDCHDVRHSYDDILHKISDFQRIPENDNENQINSSGASSRSTAGKILYASKYPLSFINRICNYSPKPQENEQLSTYREHLHHIALTQGIQNKRFPNLRTFTLDIPEPLSQDLVPQVMPIQMTLGQSSEAEYAIPEPTFHRNMTGASYDSIACSNSAEPQDSNVEEMVADKLSEASCIRQNVLSERREENNPNFLKDATHSCQSIESSIEEGSPMIEVFTPSKVLSTQDVDNDEQSNSLELSSEEIISTSRNSNEQANQSFDSILNKVDAWVDELNNLFQKLKVNLSETCHIAHEFHKGLVESHKVIECVANTSENLRALTKDKFTEVTAEEDKFNEVMANLQQMVEENQAKGKEKENPDINMEKDKKEDSDVDSKKRKNDDDDDIVDKYGDNKDVKDQGSENKVGKTTHGHIRTFVLPPEYDPDDTRWTLKYRECDPELNLVELVPGSNVFINSIKLAHCKRTAKDSKALARMLLVEIFTQSALSVCSLTGVRANAFDVSGTKVRPGLDSNARMTILSYVEEHALNKNWQPFDTQSVINSLRSKIQEVRAKHGRTA